MALTLKQALNYGGLFGSTVIAGERGIDNLIENISVLEIADSSIAKWVEKNQLYITSFYAIRDNIQQQKVVIKALYENGGCGLILCNVGMLIQNIDQEVIDYCNIVGFPLIQARADVSYIEIMTPIINELFVSNSFALAPNADDENNLLDIIINEDGTEDVLRRFNLALGREISYYDIYGRLVFGDEDGQEIENELEYINDHFNHILYICSKKGYAVIELKGKEKLVALIRSKRNMFGLFVTDYIEGEDIEAELIDRLITPCSLLFGRQDKISDYRSRIKEEFVTDLITGNFASEESARERSTDIGLERDTIDRLIIVNVNTLHRTLNKKRQPEIHRYIKNTLMHQIDSYVKSVNSKSWCAFRSDTVLIFVSKSQRNINININLFCERLKEIFDAGSLSLSISIGISRPISNPGDISVGYSQAYEAAILGRETYGPGEIVFYEQVWFYGKILDMSRVSEAQETRNWFLSDLEKYDQEHGTELVHTLKCLLYNNGNVQKTAGELYIHKNTMLQRKNRIVEILGYSPFEMPHLLNFLIALKIKEADTAKWYKDSILNR